MGSCLGLLYNEFPVGAGFSGYSYDLVCFWHKGTYVFGGTYCDYETGIEQIKTKDANIQLYPNPANDELNIVFNDLTVTAVSMEIHDLVGKLIEHIPLKTGVTYTYNTQYLSKAMYIATFYADGKLIENKKLVVIK